MRHPVPPTSQLPNSSTSLPPQVPSLCHRRFPRPRSFLGPLLCLALFTVLLPAPARGASRTIAVLEFRSGARGVPSISKNVAKRLARLTSHMIIPPSEARRLLGASVDGDVANCKGEAPCIAAIGRRLRCDEIVLVGISQLGDTILAFQRIDVASGRVMARLADSLGHRRRIKTAALDRYLRKLLPPEDFKRYGRIAILTSAMGDKVFVDEQYRGQTPLPPLKVPAPGRYSIRVQRQGHDDFMARLDVLPDALVEVTPTLGRKSEPTKWYQRWWVWAIVGGVVVGSATTAIVLTASQSPDQVPAVVRIK